MGVEFSLLLHDPPADVIRTSRALEAGTLHDRIGPFGGVGYAGGVGPHHPQTEQAAVGGQEKDPHHPSLVHLSNSIHPVPTTSSTPDAIVDEDRNAPLGASKITKIEKWLSAHKTFSGLSDPQSDGALSSEEYAIGEQRALDEILKNTMVASGYDDNPDRRLSVANVSALLVPAAMVALAGQFEEDLEVFKAPVSENSSEAYRNMSSVAHLKGSLRRMKVDFSDCVEKSELVDRLASSYASYFGRLYTIKPTAPHTASVIFCHGLGDTGAGWADVMAGIGKAMPHVKFLCPTAPTQPVTLNGGMPMPAWYDIVGLTANAPEDDEGIAHSAGYVSHLAMTEAAAVGPNRVVVGGFSQGAAVSLFCGLSSAGPLAGVVALSGYLVGRQTLLGRLTDVGKSVPILMCHGDADMVVPLTMSEASRVGIQGPQVGNPNLDYKVYRGMAHSSCPQEEADIIAFLKKVIPQK